MGNKKPLDGRAVTTFSEELDLFGGRLILRRIGGHTPGLTVSCSVTSRPHLSAGTAFER